MPVCPKSFPSLSDEAMDSKDHGHTHFPSHNLQDPFLTCSPADLVLGLRTSCDVRICVCHQTSYRAASTPPDAVVVAYLVERQCFTPEA